MLTKPNAQNLFLVLYKNIQMPNKFFVKLFANSDISIWKLFLKVVDFNRPIFQYLTWPFRILLESLVAIKSKGIVLSNPWASLMVSFIYIQKNNYNILKFTFEKKVSGLDCGILLLLRDSYGNSKKSWTFGSFGSSQKNN